MNKKYCTLDSVQEHSALAFVCGAHNVPNLLRGVLHVLSSLTKSLDSVFSLIRKSGFKALLS